MHDRLTQTRVRLTIPALIADTLGCTRELSLNADTLQGAIDAIKRDHARLAVHVFDETGRRRKHVLIFLDDESIDWIDDWSCPLQPNDRLTIIQAISGG
jgi:molybdopterin converting factor small subunit